MEKKNLFNCVNGIASGGQKNCERKDFELCLQSLGSEYSECAWHNGMEDFLNLQNNFFSSLPHCWASGASCIILMSASKLKKGLTESLIFCVLTQQDSGLKQS